MWVYPSPALLCPGREQKWTHSLAGSWRACRGEGQPAPCTAPPQPPPRVPCRTGAQSCQKSRSFYKGSRQLSF